MSNSPDGSPRKLYDALFEQMISQRELAQTSARTILRILFQRYIPKSAVDFGCGIGNWLSVAREMGVSTIHGVDGEWLKPSDLTIEPHLVTIANLEKPINLGRRFDLAICLETAEHLKPAAADTLIETLVRHAPAILFSADIPFQRGPGHVNEQWPSFWLEKFARFRYCPIDFIRNVVWYDPHVLWWYRQNTLLYVDYDWCKSQPGLLREGEIQNLRPCPNAIVLPELFEAIAKMLHELEQALRRGGNYSLEVDEYGRLRLQEENCAPSTSGRPHVTISAPRNTGRPATEDKVDIEIL